MGTKSTSAAPESARAGGAKPVTQARAAVTLNRILVAAEQLLEERPFNEISVLEICIDAEVSISSFYCRFPDKLALLDCLHERHLVRERERFASVIEFLAGSDLDLDEMLRAFAREYQSYQRSASLARQTMRLSEAAIPALALRRAASDGQMMEMIVDLIGQSASFDLDVERRRQVSFGLGMVRAGVLDAIHTPESFAKAVDMEDELITDWTVAMLLGFIRWDRSTPS